MTKQKAIEFLKEITIYDWLEENRYFEAPAAKSHHGAYKGGLFDHSLQVANELQMLTDKLELTWESKQSPIIIGLLHDVCKMDDYCFTESENGYVIDWNKNQLYSGHGEKSLIMLMGNIDLTKEEIACIRYHMGAFVDQKEWQNYSKSVKLYPNVLYTHTADMIASQIKGI